MLLKFFGSRNHNRNPDPNPNPNPNFCAEKPLIVQIIHAGGIVERYYMAFPAAWIIEKYPKFVLTRPEIFRRPWDSVVRPEEILVPGQKYFVVPILTVKKLRRRMLKSTVEISDSLVSEEKDTVTDSSKSLRITKPKLANRRVRFKGIETKTRRDSSNSGDAEDKGKKMISNGNRMMKKKNVSFSSSLNVIGEI